jgi:3-oxoacyl-(acyl-carrier-protein) synthase
VGEPGRGESGAGPITRFDPSEYAVRFACELKDYDPTTWIDRKQARRMDVFSQFALSAARMAEADSGIDISREPDRVGAAIATGIGGLTAFEDCVRRSSIEALIARPRSRSSRSSRTWLQPGFRWSSERKAHSPPNARLRRLEHGDRRRTRRDSASVVRRSCCAAALRRP